MGRRPTTPEAQAKRNKNLKMWKKGESGNPSGKRKGTRDRSTILEEMLRAQMKSSDGKPIKNPITGKRTMRYEEGVDAALIKKALNGNLEAIKEIKDTIHGKMTDKSELTGPDGSALPPSIIQIIATDHADSPPKKGR